MTDAPGPPRGPRTAHDDPDDDPASVGQLRTLRRWLVVAFVWAVAATAVGLIALLEAGSQDGGGSDDTAGARIDDVERSLTRRLDAVERQLETAEAGEDVQRLDERLQTVEDDLAQAAEDAREANETAGELSGRIDELESRVDALAAQGDGGPDPGSGEGQ